MLSVRLLRGLLLSITIAACDAAGRSGRKQIAVHGEVRGIPAATTAYVHVVPLADSVAAEATSLECSDGKDSLLAVEKAVARARKAAVLKAIGVAIPLCFQERSSEEDGYPGACEMSYNDFLALPSVRQAAARVRRQQTARVLSRWDSVIVEALLHIESATGTIDGQGRFSVLLTDSAQKTYILLSAPGQKAIARLHAPATAFQVLAFDSTTFVGGRETCRQLEVARKSASEAIPK